LTGLQDIQTSDHTLFQECLWGYFWMKLTFETEERRLCLLIWKTWVEQKGWELGNFSYLTIDLEHWLSLALKLEFTLLLFWFLDLQTLARTCITKMETLLGLHLAYCSSWYFSASIVIWANSQFLIIIRLSLCVYFSLSGSFIISSFQ
jgi:hypothetical protein